MLKEKYHHSIDEYFSSEMIFIPLFIKNMLLFLNYLNKLNFDGKKEKKNNCALYFLIFGQKVANYFWLATLYQHAYGNICNGNFALDLISQISLQFAITIIMKSRQF